MRREFGAEDSGGQRQRKHMRVVEAEDEAAPESAKDTPSLSRRRAQATYRSLFRCTSACTVRCNLKRMRWSEAERNVHALGTNPRR